MQKYILLYFLLTPIEMACQPVSAPTIRTPHFSSQTLPHPTLNSYPLL